MTVAELRFEWAGEDWPVAPSLSGDDVAAWVALELDRTLLEDTAAVADRERQLAGRLLPLLVRQAAAGDPSFWSRLRDAEGDTDAVAALLVELRRVVDELIGSVAGRLGAYGRR